MNFSRLCGWPVQKKRLRWSEKFGNQRSLAPNSHWDQNQLWLGIQCKNSHAQKSCEGSQLLFHHDSPLILQGRSHSCHASDKNYTSNISRQQSFLNFYVFAGFACARGKSKAFRTSSQTISPAEYKGKPGWLKSLFLPKASMNTIAACACSCVCRQGSFTSPSATPCPSWTWEAGSDWHQKGLPTAPTPSLTIISLTSREQE